MELGENTAQVMYGQGELFVDGIVAGLESQAAELESTANALAEAFTTSFEEVLIAGIERAIAAAEAALARMPQVPDMNFDFSGGDGAGDGAGDGGMSAADLVASAQAAQSAAEQARTALRGSAQAARKASSTPFSGSGFAGLDAARQMFSPTPAGIPARGTGIFAGNTTNVNISTGANASTTANAVRRYVNTNTLAGVLAASNNRNLG